MIEITGALGEIRTPDPQIQSLSGARITKLSDAAQASTGMVKLPACRQHFQSIRFALYSAQELAGGIRALFIVTVGDVDRRIPARGYVDDVKTRSTPPVI
jgi:hypothetical protein